MKVTTFLRATFAQTVSAPELCRRPATYKDVLEQKKEELAAPNSVALTARSKLLIHLLKHQRGCWTKGYAVVSQILLDPYLVTNLHSLIWNINEVFIVPTYFPSAAVRTADSVSQSCWTLKTSESRNRKTCRNWESPPALQRCPRAPNLLGLCRLYYAPWAHFKIFSQPNTWTLTQLNVYEGRCKLNVI